MERERSFGYWLKQRRKELDLTQEALAEQVGYSSETIRKLEADKLRPSKQLVERLAQRLGITSEQHTAFLSAARTTAPTAQLPAALVEPATVPSLPRTGNLPHLPAPLIGREREIADACALLRRSDIRLLTFTGPGGVGKTSLSLHVAEQLCAEFPDGVFFVELAPISDPQLVATTIAQVLEVRGAGGQSPEQRLCEALRERHALLVLDNFEQVLRAAALVARLLQAAPALKILVTSRNMLHLRGEREYTVAPLSVPNVQRLPSTDDLARNLAVQLFVDRAQQADPTFLLTDQNASAIAQICVRLDGLPLALELAAARSKVLSPNAMLARLNRRLAFLSSATIDLPDRQRTLRNTIAWSYDLLDADTQTWFARLAVFVTGCTLASAAAVCNATHDLTLDELDAVTTLIDQSLLRRVSGTDGDDRFVMLETIREYALERLELRSDAEQVRQWHAEYYLTFAEHAETALQGAQQEIWLNHLDAEYENLRTALRWTIDCNTTEPGLRMGAALLRFWAWRGSLHEGRRWMTELLAQPGSPSPARAKALYAAGRLANDQGDHAAARALCEDSLALWRELGDRKGMAQVLEPLGWVVFGQGDYAAAQAYFEQALELARVVGGPYEIAIALNNLGWMADARGNYAMARTIHEQALTLRRTYNDPSGIAFSLNALGHIALQQYDYGLAATRYQEGLARFQALGQKKGLSWALYYLGVVALHQQQYQQAHASYEQSLVLFQELGDKKGIARALHQLGFVAIRQERDQAALSLFEQSLDLTQATNNRRDLALCLIGLAELALRADQGVRAAWLLGAVATLHESITEHIPPTDRAMYDHSMTLARVSMAPAEFAGRWSEGRAMTPAQALAAHAPVVPPAQVSSAADQAGLTSREIEVLQLLARGMTNAQIAEALVVSPRTVNAHLTSIYGKLGVTSRHAAMRYAIDQRLI